MCAIELAGFFAFILVFGYLLPAGWCYFHYHVWGRKKLEPFRLQ